MDCTQVLWDFSTPPRPPPLLFRGRFPTIRYRITHHHRNIYSMIYCNRRTNRSLRHVHTVLVKVENGFFTLKTHEMSPALTTPHHLRKLGQENHMIILASSFSKSFTFKIKCFPSRRNKTTFSNFLRRNAEWF